MSFHKTEINTLLAADKLDEALDYLIENMEANAALNNQIVSLQSRLARIRTREKTQGIISSNDADIEYNRIREGILEVLDQIERADDEIGEGESSRNNEQRYNTPYAPSRVRYLPILSWQKISPRKKESLLPLLQTTIKITFVLLIPYALILGIIHYYPEPLEIGDFATDRDSFLAKLNWIQPIPQLFFLFGFLGWIQHILIKNSLADYQALISSVLCFSFLSLAYIICIVLILFGISAGLHLGILGVICLLFIFLFWRNSPYTFYVHMKSYGDLGLIFLIFIGFILGIGLLLYKSMIFNQLT